MFQKVYLEISKFCNLNCHFCPQSPSAKQFMATSQFAQLITQVAPLTQEICLHLLGEPLAHPELGSILELCEQHAVKVNLTTNGTLIAQQQAIILSSSSIRQLNFSLQSYLANFPTGKVEVYLEKIGHFILLAQQQRPEIYLNLRLWNQLNHQKTNDANEKIFSFLENFLQITIKRSIDLGHIKSKKILPNLYIHFDSLFTWPSFANPHQGFVGKCHGLKNHFGILVDGTVVPCCLDAQGVINLGNCFSEDLIQILASPRAKLIKDGFAGHQRVEKLCQHCPYINRFSKNLNAGNR